MQIDALFARALLILVQISNFDQHEASICLGMQYDWFPSFTKRELFFPVKK